MLLDKARKAPQHHEETYGQYQLHTWKHAEGKNRERMMTGVFYRPDVILFGSSVDEVKAALDVLDGTKPNLAGKHSPLAAPVPQGTMFLARVMGLAEAADLPAKCPMAKQIESLSLAIGEKKGESFVKGKVVAKKAELAQQMKAVIDGFRAMATIAHGSDAEAMKIINALKVEVEGKELEIEWRAPAGMVWKHLKKMEEMKKAHKQHGGPNRKHHEEK